MIMLMWRKGKNVCNGKKWRKEIGWNTPRKNRKTFVICRTFHPRVHIALCLVFFHIFIFSSVCVERVAILSFEHVQTLEKMIIIAVFIQPEKSWKVCVCVWLCGCVFFIIYLFLFHLSIRHSFIHVCKHTQFKRRLFNTFTVTYSIHIT